FIRLTGQAFSLINTGQAECVFNSRMASADLSVYQPAETNSVIFFWPSQKHSLLAMESDTNG
ncbi:MAG: hypothetical protein AB2797_05705, partial [Candidatus Thiodiazotropha sp.]